MKISKRLRVISDLIPDNSFILDIGCDHALLDIYTVLNKKNVSAIAPDINEGPLEFAKKNVEKYNVSDKVFVVLGDGLSTYKDGVDTVIMSGLGSNTIVNILNNGLDVLNNINTLIISSNNDYYFLRKNVCSLGFYIFDEIIVYDKGKYYPIIVFKKGTCRYSGFELKYGPILLKSSDSVFFDYMIFNKKKLVKIYNSLQFKHFVKKAQIKKEIRFIDKTLLKN